MQTERFRYIRYEDGSEELYDHHNDPHEWTNQCHNPEFSELKDKLKAAVLDFQETDLDVNTDKSSAEKMETSKLEKSVHLSSNASTALRGPTTEYEIRQWASGKEKAAKGAFIRIFVNSKGKEQVELKALDGTQFTIRSQALTVDDKAYIKSIQAVPKP